VAVIYKLIELGHGVGQWQTLADAIEGVRSHLKRQPDRLDALRLVGYFTSQERGATAAFTIVGPDIPAYLTAASTVLAPRSGADDAAQAVAGLPEEQRRAILDLLQPSRRRRVEALLAHARPTAGQLMTSEFLCLYNDQTASDANDHIRVTRLPEEATARIFVVDSHQHLEGAVPLAQLLRATPDTPLGSLAQTSPTARRDTELQALATLMAEHDTTLIPVLDEHDRPAGIVSADDVLELLLPTRWGQ
jgi:Mg/Co/Ni transporter MgtE